MKPNDGEPQEENGVIGTKDPFRVDVGFKNL